MSTEVFKTSDIGAGSEPCSSCVLNEEMNKATKKVDDLVNVYLKEYSNRHGSYKSHVNSSSSHTFNGGYKSLLSGVKFLGGLSTSKPDFYSLGGLVLSLGNRWEK